MLVSACLLGVLCRYDGTSKASPGLIRMARRVCMVPVCPEQLGGLPTPRPPAVIRGGDGRDVLAGGAVVRNESGRDVTDAFARGGCEALRMARIFGIRLAVMKDRSPSCGLHTPYCDRPGGGPGVAAALLDSEGLRVVELDSSGALPPGLEELATGTTAVLGAPGDRAGKGA